MEEGLEKEDEHKEEEEDENGDKKEGELKASFLRVVFVYDIILTAGDDGYLHIWEGIVILFFFFFLFNFIKFNFYLNFLIINL